METLRRKIASLLKYLFYIIALSSCAYVFSIILRVSLAENECFGRSDLIPLNFHPGKYKDKHLSEKGYGSGAYRFMRDGQVIVVWRQKINGFQHIYGPALMAYELGDKPSDLTFCANEYMEAFFDLLFDKGGIEEEDLLDRRKDLYHNALGRKMADIARKNDLSSRQLLALILVETEKGKSFIPHYSDPRVKKLKTESDMGCPGLPPEVSLYPQF